MDDPTATALANLAAKTGRSTDDWLGIARALIPLGHAPAVAKLKAEYGIGHGYANTLMLVVRAEKPAGEADVDPVDRQYAGPKAGLRPIYDVLVAQIGSFGSDVEIAPKKDTVSLRRAKQFALIAPATRDRVDLGLNLGGVPGRGRLVETGGMCTHKVAIRAASEVDAEVIGWLREAYDRAG